MVHICSTMLKLAPGSRDLYQAEKGITLMSKFTKWQPLFTQNDTLQKYSSRDTSKTIPGVAVNLSPDVVRSTILEVDVRFDSKTLYANEKISILCLVKNASANMAEAEDSTDQN